MGRIRPTTTWTQNRFELWELLLEVWWVRILDVNNNNIATVWTELIRNLNTEWSARTRPTTNWS